MNTLATSYIEYGYENHSHNETAAVIQDFVNSLKGPLSGFDCGISRIKTQSEDFVTSAKLSTSTGIGSVSGVSLIKEGVREDVLDPRSWLSAGQDVYVKSHESTSSKREQSTFEWVSFIRNNLVCLDDHGELAERIWELSEDMISDGISINNDSFAAFSMFLYLNGIQKKPQVGINDKGYLDALWRVSKDRLVEIIFHPGNESQLVTFSSDLSDKDMTYRRVASLPIRNIMDVLLNRDLDSLFYYV